MDANEVEKRGPQSARSSKLGKRPSPDEKNVAPMAGASSSQAIGKGKAAGPKDKNPAWNDAVSNENATKRPETTVGHVPNEETAKVLREAREGKNLLHYESLEEMLKDLGI